MIFMELGNSDRMEFTDLRRVFGDMDSTPKRQRSLKPSVSEQTLEIPNSANDGVDQRIEEGEEDRISSLPESIVGLILSKLPTKCAIATAILSTKWRYLFASIPNPHIEIADAPVRRYSFINFVSHLFNHILPQFSVVEQLSLSLYEYYAKQRIDEWFSTAPTCNVRCLQLHCDQFGRGISSLDVLVPFASLLCSLSLQFRQCDIVAPQSTFLFPNLTSLQVSGVRFVGLNSFERALAYCPKLRDLTLLLCQFRAEQDFVHISVPSLRNFRISGCYSHNIQLVLDLPVLESLFYNDCVAQSYPVLKSGLPSLSAATFHIKPYTGQLDLEGQLVYTRYVAKLLAACYNVKTLRFDVRNLAINLEAAFPMPTFRNLMNLNLCVLHVGGREIMPKFLSKSPILEVLHLTKLFLKHQSRLPDSVPTCLTFHLSEIVFEGLGGDHDNVKLVQYFLRTARVLKKMKICLVSCLFSFEEVMEIQKDILTSPICSNNCEIDIVMMKEE